MVDCYGNSICPKTPVKCGIKLWCLCDSFSGYCLAFSIYTGKDEAQEQAEVGLAYSVVMNLMKGYLLSRQHLYTDNFFSSICLASDLLQDDTYLCGIIRPNRKDFPRAITNGKLARVSSGLKLILKK